MFNKWQCRFCSHIYDEEKGDPDNGVPAGTKMADVSEDWYCPDCGATKEDYDLQEE